MPTFLKISSVFDDQGVIVPVLGPTKNKNSCSSFEPFTISEISATWLLASDSWAIR